MYDHLKIQHINGPLDIERNPRRAVVLCLVRNGENYVEEFVDHYLSIGFSHLAFLDNGSEDDTVQKLLKHKHVTVLQSLASYKTEKLTMKHSLMRLFGQRTWSLTADIDEFFQYPLMSELSLKSFIEYLNINSYTSVVTHMLDMMPNASVEEVLNESIERIAGVDWYFDKSSIGKKRYNIHANKVSNPEISLWYGGVRSRLFELDNLYLSKHPLNFGDGAMIIFNGHEIGNRRVADITGLFLHYKFIGDIYKRTKTAVAEKNYYNYSKEYRRYLEVFENKGKLGLAPEGCIKYENHETLLSNEMFTISESYNEFVGRHRLAG